MAILYPPDGHNAFLWNARNSVVSHNATVLTKLPVLSCRLTVNGIRSGYVWSYLCRIRQFIYFNSTRYFELGPTLYHHSGNEFSNSDVRCQVCLPQCEYNLSPAFNVRSQNIKPSRSIHVLCPFIRSSAGYTV